MAEPEPPQSASLSPVLFDIRHKRGWVWLVRDGDKLAVAGMKDAGDPLAEGGKGVLGIDVWEHAYYLDHENRRAEHVAAVLDKLVNWQFVSDRFDA